MAGSISNKGHRHRERTHRGSFWENGDSYIPITREMTQSDAWRSLGATGQAILLDMLAQYWRATKSCEEPLKGGFTYTFRTCAVDCSHSTFPKAMAEIQDRGWFVRTARRNLQPRFAPGPWREYKAEGLNPMRRGVAPQKRAAKGKTKAVEPFYRKGQVYTPFAISTLRHDAWRALKPLSRAVLLDMLHAYNAESGADNKDLSDIGFTYSFQECSVDCKDDTFYSARDQICRCGWFVTPMELQRDGTVRFVPGDWRHFQAPPTASFRRTAAARVKYIEKQDAKGAGRFQKKKGYPKNWGGGTPKIGGNRKSGTEGGTPKIGGRPPSPDDSGTPNIGGDLNIYHGSQAQRIYNPGPAKSDPVPTPTERSSPTRPTDRPKSPQSVASESQFPRRVENSAQIPRGPTRICDIVAKFTVEDLMSPPNPRKPPRA